MEPNYGNKYELKEVFLNEFKTIGIIADACRKAGISQATFHRWLKNDSKFETDYLQAGTQAYLVNKEKLSTIPFHKRAGIIKTIFEDEVGWLSAMEEDKKVLI